MELPPRARRILSISPVFYGKFGTTSACAENTQSCAHRSPRHGNYLRVRGEYNLPGGGEIAWWELPPRARRIPGMIYAPLPTSGTTSACAENTHQRPGILPACGNYLRVRGEYHVSMKPLIASRELPPRARRIHLGGKEIVGDGVNYLRVRGEYVNTAVFSLP